MYGIVMNLMPSMSPRSWMRTTFAVRHLAGGHELALEPAFDVPGHAPGRR